MVDRPTHRNVNKPPEKPPVLDYRRVDPNQPPPTPAQREKTHVVRITALLLLVGLIALFVAGDHLPQVAWIWGIASALLLAPCLRGIARGIRGKP